MVSTLDDSRKALAVAKEVHSFLACELKLPLHKNASLTTVFAAFLGLLRSCNPLHHRPLALTALPKRCPLVQRFPEVLTGKLLWYKDVEVALREVLHKGGPKLDELKMWRLMVWIWLGNGGNLHQAWRQLEVLPCCTRYKRGDMRQPLEVIRFVVHAVQATGGLMKVIGSDGLDKKSRLAHARILYLCKWHEAVPNLVNAYYKGATAFDKAINSVVGLKGDLTRKEVLIIFSASHYKKMASIGATTMPFGQGAKNGAKAFLGIAQRKGSNATEYYHKQLNAQIPKLEAIIGRLFPMLARRDRSVTLGDIEPCLCAAFVYSGLVQKLRRQLAKGRKRSQVPSVDETWQAVERLQIPAGFYAYTRKGTPVGSSSSRPFPWLPYSKIRIERVPPKRSLNKAALLKIWGATLEEPKAKRRRS